MRVTVPELLAGVALDLAIGDPRWLPHPIRGLAPFATLRDGTLEGVCLGNLAATYPKQRNFAELYL